ncbi:hypothetical protein B0J12DRAFT_165129 [Macrophomina phaseolina]|uniref:Uncharacterized protein n=1 Tax=Macrophomina phaseolina TaxID=35725 RepID=A0ABQ8GS46_9PEZI|nr:hypothetical protein B0J12DRAFT_165129 [Macrophomina phaseolina]
MRPSTYLLAAAGTLASAPLASAQFSRIRKDMLISPREQRPLADLPIRVATAGQAGFLHVQFPIECKQCFPADPTKPKKNLQDGFLEIDFRVTRGLGLDGDAGAQVNGYTVLDEAFPLRSEGDENFRTALHLFVDGEDPDVAPSVAVEGELAFSTIWANGTHDVKGVSYNLTKVGEVVPAASAGFRVSYIREPQNGILRIEQGTANVEGERWPFEKPELWVAVGRTDGNTEHFAWKKELDWLNRPHAGVYPGWDQEFVNCKTTACRVNKMHTKVTKAYDECVERVERPEQFESGVLPPGCYVLLSGYYAKQNIMWVGCGIVFMISQLLRWNLKRQQQKVQKIQQQKELDEQALERLEDDAVSYMMEVQSKAQTAAASSAEAVEEEKVKSRKAYQGSDE